MLEKGTVVFGNWTVEEEIGSGAFGTVYKIKKEEFGRVYYSAMKVLHIPQDKDEHKRLRSEGMDDASISTYYSQVVQDFVSEIELLSSLDGITNIVDYKDHIIEPNDNLGYTIYIKMQLLTPVSNTLLNSDGSVRFMDVKEIIKLGVDMCSALEVCEKRNIIHRDIKIDNIFISENGDYKLGDFGIAKQLEATQGEMSKKGTLLYMAPEVFRGEKYDKTADIYSLGVVLYRLLNKNRAPFFPNYPDPIKFSDKETANTMRLKGEEFPDIIGISSELNAVLKKACAFNPKDRYFSANEFKSALNSVTLSMIFQGTDEPTAESVAPVFEELANKEATVGVFSDIPVVVEDNKIEDKSDIIVDDNSIDEEKTESVFDMPPVISETENTSDEITEPTLKEVEQIEEQITSKIDEATVSVFVSDENKEVQINVTEESSVREISSVNSNKVVEPKQEIKKPNVKKKSINIAITILFVVATISVIAIIFVPLNTKYNDAVELMAAGEYNEAISAFKALDGYKDSVEKITECETLASLNKKYNNAIALMDEGKYNKAIRLFSELKDFKKSKNYFSEILNKIAVKETISAELYHTVGLKEDGTVIAIGNNDYGQCDVEDWKDIVAISTNSFYTVGLKSDRTVVAVGNIVDEECNVKDWKDIVAISAGESHIVGLKSNGTVVAIGGNWNGQCNVEDWTDIIAISAGYAHTVGLKSDGTVVATEYLGDKEAYNGQCDVEDWKDVVAISTDASHTVGLKKDGTVVATKYIGDKDFYLDQCEVEDWSDIVAISAGEGHTVGLKKDGTVVAVGLGAGLGNECDVEGLTDVVAISAGFWNTFCLKSDGTVVFSGSTLNGENDISSWKNIKLPDNK